MLSSALMITTRCSPIEGGIAMNGTTICTHQEGQIAAHLREAEDLGRRIGLTRAHQKRLWITTIAAFDASAEEQTRWQRRYIRLLFKGGEVSRCCECCGHIASGALVP